MSTTTFNRADFQVTNVLAQVYGPVASGTTVIAFHGTASNIDNVNKSSHTLTLEIHNGASVVNRLNAISIPYGGAAKLPKMVLKAGDIVHAVTDTTLMIDLSIELLEIAG